jgi:CDP-glycerol glycerophosphotransferase
MPQVSVIVPVYRTEGFLAECLESILSQDFAELELIAVNDASPDGSLALLRNYKARDPRVRVIDLPKNQGLGAARNAGIEAAQGKWLWFVDSDDTIIPGAVSRAVARGEHVGAEVVVFHWTRHYRDGHVLPGSRGRVLVAAPDHFTVSDYPAILQLLQIVCNKLISRDLLNRLALRFVDGWYEDTPFTYPLLVGATAITTLPDALLQYRQREEAITRTHSPRHLEVLSQWSIAMKKVRAMPRGSSEVRATLFHIMVRHCIDVLLKHDRVPVSLQKTYLRRLRRLLRVYRPEGRHPAPSRLERLQQLLLQSASPKLVRAQWRLTRAVRPILHGGSSNTSHPAQPPSAQLVLRD